MSVFLSMPFLSESIKFKLISKTWVYDPLELIINNYNILDIKYFMLPNVYAMNLYWTPDSHLKIPNTTNRLCILGTLTLIQNSTIL